MRIGLISCVKSKLPVPAAARDLYVSPLFRGMRSYVEINCDKWFILSAQYGLLSPDRVIKPYEKTLLKMPVHERGQWGQRVQTQLLPVLPPRSEIMILAGERYREEIVSFLVEEGHLVTVPMSGKKLGAQLSWLKEQST